VCWIGWSALLARLKRLAGGVVSALKSTPPIRMHDRTGANHVDCHSQLWLCLAANGCLQLAESGGLSEPCHLKSYATTIDL
jgi:hypothetical protein